MKTRLVVTLFLSLVILILAACTSPVASTPSEVSPTELPTQVPQNPTDSPTAEPVAVAELVSYSKDVQPIFQAKCIECHNSDRTSGGIDLSSYASLMNVTPANAVVVPGDASGSLLVSLIQDGSMPKRGSKVTNAQLQKIIDWVNQGALDN